MAFRESRSEGGVSQEEYDQKLAELTRKQAKGGRSWEQFMEKLKRWVEDDDGENDIECQAEFPDWPIEKIRKIYEELAELEDGGEEWES
ncbi:MAG: hypothetical protein Q8P56_06025 [Candidatus Uhrbacteria bacterium]|nr:hypothetical protein [Candidatus Uhrbacteria bacterium]